MKKSTLGLILLTSISYGYEPSPALVNYLSELKIEAKKVNPAFTNFDEKQGKEIFFAKKMVDGKEISCVSCHTQNLTKQGLNVKTNKTIDPLSPSANKSRLSDAKEMKKWLKRNFNDVYKREGTAEEKGDVLTFISKN
ncbi:MAG: DUF1924 domain-containing protein [Arcobacter sp.]|nr:DUF1924 domain-containing protein [Arcobacter sp.]